MPDTNGQPLRTLDRIPPSEDRRRERERALRKRRIRRRGKRAYIRSVQFLPSIATLGNAVCGFAAIYVATLMPGPEAIGNDRLLQFLVGNQYVAAVYLLLAAMLFDAVDGRLARFARHTTDFGGQLDSLADAISFGAAPAIIALHVFKFEGVEVPLFVSRLIWAMAALYVCCTLIRLARFNVSNEHGEQAHMSFLGLPSPGAAGGVLGFILLQQTFAGDARDLEPGFWQDFCAIAASILTILLPLVLLATGLLMVSNIRYGHMVNKYLRGNARIGMVVLGIAFLLGLIVFRSYALALLGIVVAYSSPVQHYLLRLRRIGQSDA
ncbi:MAG: CDP-alcohol phosphatidyltransferase family protein [Planctomycetota bacterium]